MSLLLGIAWVLPLGAALAACQGSSSPSAPADASEDGAGALDVSQVVDDGPDCNPCFQVCACSPGQTYFSPGDCQWHVCVGGTFGGTGCVGLGCDDAGDASVDDSSSADASGSGGDAPSDGARDGAIGADADAASDASLDGAVDAASDSPLD